MKKLPKQPEFLPNKKPNTINVEYNVITMYEKYQLHQLYCFWEDIYQLFFLKVNLFLTLATNQIQRFGQKPYKK